MTRVLSKSKFGLARSFTITLGVCAIAWAFFSVPDFLAETPFSVTALRILSGDSFNARQLNSLALELETTPDQRLRSLALDDVAVVRLQLLLSKFDSGEPVATSDLADLLTSVTDALGGTPTASFLWLMDFWLRGLSGMPVDTRSKLLSMSYATGPNEGWIAVRRNSLALGSFVPLPIELRKAALSEFARLVRSGFYRDAANILAGPGWAVRDQLLSQLVEINEAGRRSFAAALASRDIDLKIPSMDGPSSQK